MKVGCWVLGALVLSNGEGFLSWAADKTLRLWDREGEVRQIFRGHEGDVLGAVALCENRAFLSWGTDKTVRLWRCGDECGQILHIDEPFEKAAKMLDGGEYFITWNIIGNIELLSLKVGPKGRVGETKFPISVDGVVKNGDGFTYIDQRGEKYFYKKEDYCSCYVDYNRDLRGYIFLDDDSGVVHCTGDGLAFLPRGQNSKDILLDTDGRRVSGVDLLSFGFVSFNHDGTMHLWRSVHHEGQLLVGHADEVEGVLEQKGNRGFLSWGRDGTVRVWDKKGSQTNIWVSPTEFISSVAHSNEPDKYFIVFGKHVDLLYLP